MSAGIESLLPDELAVIPILFLLIERDFIINAIEIHHGNIKVKFYVRKTLKMK